MFGANIFKFCRQALGIKNEILGLTGVRSFHAGNCKLALRNPARFQNERNRSREHDNDWTRNLDAWTEKNNTIYPPLDEIQGIRPAEIYHGRAKIRQPEKKMFHVSHLIRNMNIDEAIYKLDYIKLKSAKIIREVLLEAQELAVRDHNVEFKSNLHVVHSFAAKHSSERFLIYRACGRTPCIGHCRFSNYYLMLREGPAPLPTPKKTALDQALAYVQELKDRKIIYGLTL